LLWFAVCRVPNHLLHKPSSCLAEVFLGNIADREVLGSIVKLPLFCFADLRRQSKGRHLGASNGRVVESGRTKR